MKSVLTLPNCPQGLADYLAQGVDATDWSKFHNDAPVAYRELRDALAKLQRSLCGYCEIDLVVNDIQVEHIIPQADLQQGAAKALDYLNLIAACRGGTESMFDTDALNDPERFRRPVNDNRSCGQAKGDTNDPNFIDPRNLPALPPLLCVQPDGTIVADNAACDAPGIEVKGVERTISILGLKSERLRLARENRWNDLKRNWDAHLDDAGAMQVAARQELLAGVDGALSKFFTTGRSYFGRLGEEILVESPQEWI